MLLFQLGMGSPSAEVSADASLSYFLLSISWFSSRRNLIVGNWVWANCGWGLNDGSGGDVGTPDGAFRPSNLWLSNHSIDECLLVHG